MPIKYQRKAGSRKYTDYMEESLLECLNEMINGRILDKLKCRHSLLACTSEEEREFLQCIISLDYIWVSRPYVEAT